MPSGMSLSVSFSVAVNFFKRFNNFYILIGMLRACTDVRKAQIVQDLPHMPLVIINAKPRLDHGLQIHPPPADDAVYRGIRTGFDQRCQFGTLRLGQPRF